MEPRRARRGEGGVQEGTGTGAPLRGQRPPRLGRVGRRTLRRRTAVYAAPIGEFRFDEQALVELDEILHTHLAPIELDDAYTRPLMEHSQASKALEPLPEYLRVYTDSYIELTRLLEEIRFEVALAALLLLDYTRKLDAGEAPAVEHPDFPLGVEVVALLRRYFREIPPPSELFSEPHSALSGVASSAGGLPGSSSTARSTDGCGS